MTANAYPTIAVPLCEGDQISPSTPPVFVTGAEPNNPAKNLVIRMVEMSFAVAVPKEKQAAMKYGTKTAGLLPYLTIYQHDLHITHSRTLLTPHSKAPTAKVPTRNPLIRSSIQAIPPPLLHETDPKSDQLLVHRHCSPTCFPSSSVHTTKL